MLLVFAKDFKWIVVFFSSELELSEGLNNSLRSEQNKKKAEKVTAPSSEERDASLTVEDLDDPPLSPAPDSHSSMDE